MGDNTEPPPHPAEQPHPADATAAEPNSTATKKSNRRFFRTLVLIVISGPVIVILVALVASISISNKVVTYPGQTTDIESHIEIVGTDFYPSPGEIRFVAVRSDFSPSIFDIAVAWFDGSHRIQNHNEVLGNQTVAQNRERGQLSMTQSQDVAVRVALEQLGYEVFEPVGVFVQSVQADTAADGVLTPGEVVVAVNDRATLTVGEFVAAITQFEPGETIQLTVANQAEPDQTDPDQAGPDQAEPDQAGPDQRSVTLGERDGRAFLGISAATQHEVFDLPFEVDLDFGNIGGPSAGLAICLSVIDSLTEDELTGGLNVVVTGTISADGSVGRVGGVEQKAHSALRDGADLMLVPAAQIGDAQAVLGDYIEVVGVESLTDALAVLAQRAASPAAS